MLGFQECVLEFLFIFCLDLTDGSFAGLYLIDEPILLVDWVRNSVQSSSQVRLFFHWLRLLMK
jgi:hypothetical protein